MNNNQDDKKQEELRGSRTVSFNLFEGGHHNGSVVAEHSSASASFYQCTYGSVNVKIYSGGQKKADFDIPEVGYTTVTIPFSVTVGNTISYTVAWKSGNDAGYAKGSFTLNY